MKIINNYLLCRDKKKNSPDFKQLKINPFSLPWSLSLKIQMETFKITSETNLKRFGYTDCAEDRKNDRPSSND